MPGIGIGVSKHLKKSSISWSTYWATLISATVENAAPTNVVLTFPSPKSLTKDDFTIAGFTISSASWTGAVLTLILSTSVIYTDTLVVTFVKTGGTANVTNNVFASFTLSVIGTGAGVATLRMTTSETQTVTLSDNGRFYTDAAGTLGESTSWNLTSGGDRVIYLKLPSGTSQLVFNAKKITKWGTTSNDGWASGANAPSIAGNVSCFTSSLTVLRTGGNNTLGGSISGLTGLTYLLNNTFTGGCTYSGSISGMTELKNIYVTGTNTITGDVSGTKLTYINVSGSNTLTGSIAGLTGLTYVAVSGYNTLSGDISGLISLTYFTNISATSNHTGNIVNLTSLYHLDLTFSPSSLTFTNVTALKQLCVLKFSPAQVCTEAVINQILADFWTNKDEAKGSANRIIDLRGAVHNNAPIGQGLTDAAALAAYHSPTPPGTAALWTVSYRTTSAFFYGTSITYGAYVTSANRFSKVYATADSLVENNYGVAGKKLMQDPTTPDGLSMYETMSLIVQKPNHARYLILEFGANDYTYFPTYADEFIADYEAIIDYAITKGWAAANIKLLTPFLDCAGFDFTVLKAAIDAVGTSKSVQVIDTATNLYNGGDYSGFMVDCVHPNATGHARMSAYIDANIIAP